MITLEQVQTQAEKVVERFGDDHVNPGEFGGVNDGDSCLYTTFDGSHCFAAQILVDLGVKVPAYGEDGNRTAVDHVPSVLAALEPAAVRWLTSAQGHADAGNSWGVCLEVADE